jgi:hypothetical protein
MTRPRWFLVLAFASWTLLVWATRIDNIWADAELTTTGKVGRTLLAASFVASAVALGWVLRVCWRHRPGRRVRTVVGVVAAWTTAVWVVRAVGIASADHSGAFVAVHLALAVVSIGLGAGSWLAVRDVGGSHASPVDAEAGATA